MHVQRINTKAATTTVEIELGAMLALRSYLEKQIGYCELNGFPTLVDKYKTQHHDIQNALDKIREHHEANQ